MATIRIVSDSPILENELSRQFTISEVNADIGIIVLKTADSVDARLALTQAFEESHNAILSMIDDGIDTILTVGDLSTIQGNRWKNKNEAWKPSYGYSLDSVQGLSHLILEVIMKSKSSKVRIFSAKLVQSPDSEWLSKNIKLILANNTSNFIEHQGISHITV